MSIYLRRYWVVAMCIVISILMEVRVSPDHYLLTFWTGWLGHVIWRQSYPK